jgi:hypothetical protein
LAAWFIRFRAPILIFLISRVALLGIQAIVIGMGGNAANAPWIDHWVRWDAIYYNDIAHIGYTYSPDTHTSAAFFPFYPALVRLVSPWFGADLALLLVSNLALLVALIYMQRLAEREGMGTPAQRHAALYMVGLPLGFFLGAGYAESVFLALSIASAYHARNEHWTPAIVLAMLATLTRVNGVLLFGVIVLEWLEKHDVTVPRLFTLGGWRAVGSALRRDGWVMCCALGIPLTLGSLSLYQYVYFGSPLLFIEAHDSVRGQADLMRVVTDFMRVLRLDTIRLDLMFGAAMLVLMPLLLLRAFQIRASYGWYLLISALIPLPTGLMSYMRLMGGIFPIYLALGGLSLSGIAHAVILAMFSLLQLLGLFVFFSGGFVS